MPHRSFARTKLVCLTVALAGCVAGTPVVRAPGGAPPRGPMKADAPPRPVGPSGAKPANQPGPASDVAANLTPVTPTGDPAAASRRVPSLTGVVRAPAGIVANNGARLITDNGAGVVSNNGAGVVSNNGGNVISDQGGSLVGAPAYRLAATAQAPLAGARLYLLDAAGRPLRAPSGELVTTVTDDQGRYAFAGDLPTRNTVLAVELQDGRGRWQAILPKDAPVPRRVDLDVVSTLATTYILDRYVAGQRDPLATFDRLPASEEARTRAETDQALAGDALSLPTRFVPEEAVPLLDRLRRTSKALDAQLEVVRKLLLVAGASNLGDGLPAQDVTLGEVSQLLPAADGGVYLVCPDDRRIWLVGPDGMLRAAVGSGVWERGDLTDFGGPAAGLSRILAVVPGGNGRPVITEAYEDPTGEVEPRTLVLGPDGFLTQLPAYAARILPGPGAEVFGVRPASPEGDPPHWFAMSPGAGVRDLRPLTSEEWAIVNRIVAVGRDDAGKVFVLSQRRLSGTREASRYDTGLFSFDPASQRLTELWRAPTEQAGDALLDVHGNMLYRAADASFRVRRADGRDQALQAGELESKVGFGRGSAFLLAPDGTIHVSRGGVVYRLRSGLMSRVAGREAVAAAGSARSLDFSPSGLAVGADGSVYASNASRIFRLDPGGQFEAIDDAPPPETGASAWAPKALGVDAAGNVFVESKHGLFRLDGAGRPDVIWKPSEGAFDRLSFDVAPDGTVILEVGNWVGEDYQLRHLRRPPGGELSELGLPPDGTRWEMAFDALGRLWAVHLDEPDGDYRVEQHGVYRQRVDGGWEPMGRLDLDGVLGALAVDAAGRFYGAARYENRVVRLNLDASRTALAGPGGHLFDGTEVDDSVEDPTHLALAPNGDLYFSDSGHRQIKRIPAASLVEAP